MKPCSTAMRTGKCLERKVRTSASLCEPSESQCASPMRLRTRSQRAENSSDQLSSSILQEPIAVCGWAGRLVRAGLDGDLAPLFLLELCTISRPWVDQIEDIRGWSIRPKDLK